MTIYAATSNPGKLAEFAASASGGGVEVLALPGLAGMPEPVEDAATFMGNAELKAQAYSRLAPGLLVFADDSGLCVSALGGLPGVRSARFAADQGYGGEGSVNERNNACLTDLLRERGGAGSAAQFRCALALARDGELLLRAEGEVRGTMLTENRGVGGFGYDPLFLVPEFGRTLAELTREEKWSVSHRGRAFRDLLRQLKGL